MIRFLFLFLLITTSLFGESIELSFDELLQNPNSFHEKNVEVRGFVYKTSDDSWILSTEPNLKSCCVGSKAKRDKQLFLHGNFEAISSDRAVKLRGKFLANKDTLQLQDAILIKDSPRYILFLAFFFLTAIISWIFFSKKVS